MTRARISTTVDRELLQNARRARATANDAELIDEALAALLARDRAVEIDAAYAAAYTEHPVDEPDEWATSHRSARPPVGDRPSPPR